MQASGNESWSPHFGGIAQNERILTRGAEFIDREQHRERADRRDAHAAHRRTDFHGVAGVRRDITHRRERGVPRGDVDDARDPEIRERRTQLRGGEQRDERIAAAFLRVVEDFAKNGRRRTGGVGGGRRWYSGTLRVGTFGGGFRRGLRCRRSGFGLW